MKRFYLLLIGVVSFGNTLLAGGGSKLPIIPEPSSVVAVRGSFILTDSVNLVRTKLINLFL